jgi:hypothetical protein
VKPRMFLFHWNEGEARTLAAAHRAAGWRVETESSDGARGGKRVVSDPPDAIVVYLTRLPSHGRETAHGIRSYKATKTTPILFVGGAGEAVAKTRAKVPDARFVSERALPRALASLAGKLGSLRAATAGAKVRAAGSVKPTKRRNPKKARQEG